MKYGPDAFTFAILELVPDVDALDARERHYIETRPSVYNFMRVPRTVRELSLSPEALARRKEQGARIGRAWAGKKRVPFAPDHRQLLAEGTRRYYETHADARASTRELLAKYRRQPTSEERAKAAEKRRGRKMSPESIEKMRASAKARWQRKEERERQRLRTQDYFDAHPEARTQTSEAIKQKWQDAEYRAMMSAAHRAESA